MRLPTCGPSLPRAPIALAIREEAGQLVIGWNAGALAEGSRLEIQDGSERTILMLPANASSATYGLQGDDVEVRLSTDTRMGGAHWEAARFVTKEPPQDIGFQRAAGPDWRADARSGEITPFPGGPAGADQGIGGSTGGAATRER